MPVPEKPCHAFGRRLRSLRNARGWTQEELARRTQRHWTYIGGLERGERNPTLLVLCDLAAALEVSPAVLVADQHLVCGELNATPDDVLEAIARGFRAKIDVKGKLAELFLSRRLDALKAEGAISAYDSLDEDGQPDFIVTYKQAKLIVECKNIRNETYKTPPSFKVELQRTRNSMDGTPTRAYKADDFDVLGVALFNQTGNWEFLYVAVGRLERRPDARQLLKVMQRVPMEANDVWNCDPLRAFDDAMEARR